MKLSKEELKEKFGKPLRKFIIYKSEGSAKLFAVRLGISPSMLSQLINGYKSPSLEIARKLEKLGFDISIIDEMNKQEEFLPEVISYTELKFQYMELKERYYDLKEHNRFLSKRIDELQKRIKSNG